MDVLFVNEEGFVLFLNSDSANYVFKYHNN